MTVVFLHVLLINIILYIHYAKQKTHASIELNKETRLMI